MPSKSVPAPPIICTAFNLTPPVLPTSSIPTTPRTRSPFRQHRSPIIHHPTPPLLSLTLPTPRTTIINTRTRPSTLTPTHDFLSPPPPQPQLLNLPPLRASIPYPPIKDQRLRRPRPPPLADFPLAVEIRAADVEGVDVGGDDAAEEEDAVEEGVGVRAGEEENGKGGKEQGEEG